MQVEWNPKKAKSNLQKHGVSFSDAEAVLFDPYALSFEDQSAQGEQRFIIMGMDHLWRLLVVVYTYRGDNIRLISARPATAKERRKYETGI
ncbi:BrnT family toxin [Sphaerospermopsis torques-reginae]|uniref:BrnT family toxin n=1 Tax=Sphaerospermopsis torques-reginae ITEP-024 TaxID=984208 RepID=A0ABX8WV37_9CYAN|nr:BrnT family toxin [Sphaerospermopsis torques-reginae]QYX30293.1 BrnT family toxin [Sphaerospermopsis torques-reginae ITEP-024]